MKKINSGFTLIEMLIYIAITMIFITGVTNFGLNIIYGRVKTRNYQSVTQNLRIAEKRILFEIRNASGINSVAAQAICLSNSDVTRNPTRIYLSGGVVRIGWGGGSPTCASLTNDMTLMDNLVTATSLNFVNLSATNTKNIQFSLTLTAVNPSGKAEFARTQTFESAAEVRSN